MKISSMIRVMTAIILVLTFITFTNLFFLNQAINNRTAAFQNRMELQKLGDQLASTSDYLENEIRSYVQYGEMTYLNAYLKEINETKTTEKTIARLKELNAPKDLMMVVNNASRANDTLKKMNQEAIDEVGNQQYDTAKEIVYGSEYKSVKILVNTNMNQFQKKLDTWMEKETDKTDSKMSLFLKTTLIMNVILLISMISNLLILRVKIRPMNQLTELSDRVAEGDLTVEQVKTKNTKDEVGLLAASINKMVINLQGLVKQVQSTSEQVASSAEELLASSEQSSRSTEEVTMTIQQLAVGAENQVQSIEETAEIIQQIAESSNQIAINSEDSLQTANIATEKAMEGNKALEISVNQMNSIHQSVNGLAEVVKGLGDHSKEIGQIVDVITGIAEQTNLLALNAAIEAARAGEHGRGFAVVADEVRKLAEQSADSAKQISNLIAVIQAETDKAVHSMENTTNEVEGGIKLVNTAGTSFNEIQSSIDRVTEKIREVSSAVEGMANDTKRVVSSAQMVREVAEKASFGTQNVSASSQQQLASMEEITASAQSLTKVADELHTQIGKFQL
nr:HAMP domain-containing methyl-accepting chemotaxis protein [Bacillus massilionigeriensis]